MHVFLQLFLVSACVAVLSCAPTENQSASGSSTTKGRVHPLVLPKLKDSTDSSEAHSRKTRGAQVLGGPSHPNSYPPGQHPPQTATREVRLDQNKKSRYVRDTPKVPEHEKPKLTKDVTPEGSAKPQILANHETSIPRIARDTQGASAVDKPKLHINHAGSRPPIQTLPFPAKSRTARDTIPQSTPADESTNEKNASQDEHHANPIPATKKNEQP